jgi:8-oxo-dGTP pyrophosphatase MutT (NUDIX family)
VITIESLAKAACNAATRSATQGEFVALYDVKQAAAKAWRDRVEVLAHNGKGKVFGGIWDSDKSFSLPGGGIEANENAAKAALRELK